MLSVRPLDSPSGPVLRKEGGLTGEGGIGTGTDGGRAVVPPDDPSFVFSSRSLPRWNCRGEASERSPRCRPPHPISRRIVSTPDGMGDADCFGDIAALNVDVPKCHSLSHFPIINADLIPIRLLSLSPSRFHISARLFPRLVRPLAFYSLLLLLLLRLRLPFEASARARCWKRRATRKRRQRQRRRHWRLQRFPPSFLPSFLPSFNASISLATAAAPRSPARSVTDVAPAYFLVSEARFLCSSSRRPLNVSGPRVWFIQLSLSLSLSVLPPSSPRCRSPKGVTASGVEGSAVGNRNNNFMRIAPYPHLSLPLWQTTWCPLSSSRPPSLPLSSLEGIVYQHRHSFDAVDGRSVGWDGREDADGGLCRRRDCRRRRSPQRHCLYRRRGYSTRPIPLVYRHPGRGGLPSARPAGPPSVRPSSQVWPDPTWTLEKQEHSAASATHVGRNISRGMKARKRNSSVDALFID